MRSLAELEILRVGNSQRGISESVRVYLATHLYSTLTGIRAGDWWRLLRENRFAVGPASWPRALCLTVASVSNSLLSLWEECRHGRAIEMTDVAPPLFILGHWRSGTTHLHNLLCLDERFAFPNLYQVLYPHHFHSTEKWLGRIWANGLPRTRLIDNMTNKFRVPFEEEFALAVTCCLSPYLGWAFPGREDHYDRYLTLRGIASEELERWKRALRRFLKTVSFENGRPLVLKSPTHTARVRLLLEMFPQARFVHIHRDPYTVFLSTKHMVEIAYTTSNLRSYSFEGLDERILRTYRVMHEVYFEERGLIPPGRLHDLAYEDLERDPLGEVRRIYEQLGLPDFAPVQVPLGKYLEGIRNYRKNEHRELPADLRARIRKEWARSFEEWGYQK